MKRITPRTCLWPLTGVLCVTFALSLSLTYRSNHYCYAGTCGEWLFPFQARLHVIVWYLWISLSVSFLGVRAFQPSLRSLLSKSPCSHWKVLGKQVRVSSLLLIPWIGALYGILIGIWWNRLQGYFEQRGNGLPGNNVVAAVALTGHLADVTMGMVLLPVSRHSALSSFFKLSPTTTYTFHMVQAYVLFGLIITHGVLYSVWATLYTQHANAFRHVLPVLNPTYLFNEVWPGNTSSLGVWRASLIFTGSISGLIMVAMFFTSFPVVRRNHFNLFYFTHLLGIVAVVVICLHASTMFYCTVPGLSMWLLDWTMRLVELRTKLDSRLIALGNGWYRYVLSHRYPSGTDQSSLSLPLPRKRLSGCACHSPLAHFYIHHSESSIREIHPFTTITHLASEKPAANEDDSVNIQFLFRRSVPSGALQTASQPKLRKSTQWTHKLASLLDEESGDIKVDKATDTSGRAFSDTGTSYGVETPLRLEGPYFTPAMPNAYKTVICLVAGTGLSGAIAIATAFKAQRARPRGTPGAPTPATGKNTCTMSGAIDSRWDGCVVIWTVRGSDYVDMPFFDNLCCEGLEFRVHKTGGGHARPDISKDLVDVCGDHGAECWCYISGPNGFIAAAEHACNAIDGLKWFAAKWD